MRHARNPTAEFEKRRLQLTAEKDAKPVTLCRPMACEVRYAGNGYEESFLSGSFSWEGCWRQRPFFLVQQVETIRDARGNLTTSVY